LNKVDRVKKALVPLLVESIKEINPQIRAYPVSFGRLDAGTLRRFLEVDLVEDLEPCVHCGGYHGHGEHHHDHGEHHEGEHDHCEESGFARELQSYGRTFQKIFDRICLESFFEGLKDQRYGQVVRAKGIFKTTGNWVKLELASGEVRMDPGPVARESVVSVIGHGMDIPRIEERLAECLAE
jgi:G3E family GTPase